MYVFLFMHCSLLLLLNFILLNGQDHISDLSHFHLFAVTFTHTPHTRACLWDVQRFAQNKFFQNKLNDSHVADSEIVRNLELDLVDYVKNYA